MGITKLYVCTGFDVTPYMGATFQPRFFFDSGPWIQWNLSDPFLIFHFLFFTSNLSFYTYCILSFPRCAGLSTAPVFLLIKFRPTDVSEVTFPIRRFALLERLFDHGDLFFLFDSPQVECFHVRTGRSNVLRIFNFHLGRRFPPVIFPADTIPNHYPKHTFPVYSSHGNSTQNTFIFNFSVRN
jgi:hypothetical protein